MKHLLFQVFCLRNVLERNKPYRHPALVADKELGASQTENITNKRATDTEDGRVMRRLMSALSVAASVEDGEYLLVLDTCLDKLILPELAVIVEVKGREEVARPAHHRLLVEARGLVQRLEDLHHLLHLDGPGAVGVKHLERPPRFLISGAAGGHVSGEHELLRTRKCE